MIIRKFAVLLAVSSLFAAVIESNTGWSYLSSDQQTFYIFIGDIDIMDSEGAQIEGYGDGSGSSSSTGNEDCMQDPSMCDVVAAFMSHDISEDECLNTAEGNYVDGHCEVCVGWIYYNSYSGNQQGTVATTLPVMGVTSSQDPIYDYYCDNSNIPTLKFYDASEGTTYNLTTESTLGEFFNNNIFVYCSTSDDSSCEEIHFLGVSTSSLGNDSNLPESFEVIDIFPNPFNPSTQIEYTLNSIEYINITVYDMIGREIVTLFDGYQPIGFHQLNWTPDYSVASGNYIIRIETPNNSFTNKVTYLK